MLVERGEWLTSNQDEGILKSGFFFMLYDFVFHKCADGDETRRIMKDIKTYGVMN